MPENDAPMWPSDDEDTSSAEPKGTEGDGEATLWLPIKGLANGKTEELVVPKVTEPESGSWFKPVVEVEEEPDVPEVPAIKWSAFEPATPVEPATPAEPEDVDEQPEEPEKAPEPEEPAEPEQAAEPEAPAEQKDTAEAENAEEPEDPEDPEDTDGAQETAQLPIPAKPEKTAEPENAAEPDKDEAAEPEEAEEVSEPQETVELPTPSAESDSEKTVFVQPVQPKRPDEQRPEKPDWDQFDRAAAKAGTLDAEPKPEPPKPERKRVEPPRPAPVPSATMHARPVRIEPKPGRFDAEATVVGLKPVQQQPEEAPAPKAEPAPKAQEVEEETKPEAAPKPKKRKVLVITGVVVVLLVAALGGAAAMPNVSNRLGLPWAPNAPKGDMPKPVGVTRVLHGPDVNGVAPTKEGLASALKGPASSADLGTLTGSVIDAATGNVLWEKNSGTPLTPASTTKILVVAAALLSLDHGKQLSTKIVQGADPGTVILVAGGDTSLTALPLGTDSPLYPGAAHVDDLVAQVKKAAGGKVSKVQLDISLFKGPTTAPGWDPEDTAAGSTYMAPVLPVMADGGRTDPKDDHAPRVANPAAALTQKIAQKLEAQAGGTTTAPEGAKVLGEVKSPPLPELANSLLQLSDNMLADVLARQTALAKGGEASFEGGAAATMAVLKEAGFDLTGVQIFDGSGLSEQNKIPAKVLGEILAVAAAPDGQDPRTAKLRPMLAGLPVAGGSGTLAERYGDPSSSVGKGWVRGKTGTLSGVNTLAGVVLDTDGRMLVFALMSSGSDQNKGRAALDVVAATLHQCGCR